MSVTLWISEINHRAEYYISAYGKDEECNICYHEQEKYYGTVGYSLLINPVLLTGSCEQIAGIALVKMNNGNGFVTNGIK